MTRPTPTLPPWAALTAGAVACLLAATTVPGGRVPLTVMAAGLGLGAIANYGTARARAGLPSAAVAWLGAGCVAGALSWGLWEQYPYGYALAGPAGFQLLVGTVLLPGHLRRSARQTAADRARDHR